MPNVGGFWAQELNAGIVAHQAVCSSAALPCSPLWKWKVTCESAVFFSWDNDRENAKQSQSRDGLLLLTQLSLCIHSCKTWNTHTHTHPYSVMTKYLALSWWERRETAIPLSLHDESCGRYWNKHTLGEIAALFLTNPHAEIYQHLPDLLRWAAENVFIERVMIYPKV